MKALFAAFVLLCACGPTHVNGGGDDAGGADDDDDDGPPPPPPQGTVTGTVWAPGNAIGSVPAGYEIPVAGALVYVADTAPDAIPEGAYCERCTEHPPNYVVTDAKGHFELTGIAAGNRRLVIEKAQFRLEELVDINEELGVALTPAQTTLPSEHDPDNGKWVPRVAIAVGDSDHTEDIFAKMGILGLSSEGGVIESTFDDSDRVELYGNPIDPPYPSHHHGDITDLFGSLTTMLRYHIIFVPCNFESDLTALSQASVRQNIRDYVAAGGKLYVTDWSAEWEDAAFPEFIGFDAAMDTAPGGAINNADGDYGHFALHGKATDPDLATWLDGQKAPLVIPAGGEEEDFPSTYEEGTTDASDFVIEGSWTLIRTLPEINLGTDENGDPVMETAKTWISGDYNGSYYPHTVTFEPSCGRVLYSTYHTAQKTHEYLIPQERVLLYLIMEIGVCNDGPIVN
jgi:hypothetical protein